MLIFQKLSEIFQVKEGTEFHLSFFSRKWVKYSLQLSVHTLQRHFFKKVIYLLLNQKLIFKEFQILDILAIKDFPQVSAAFLEQSEVTLGL